MKITTCLSCKKECTQRELDAYYECFACQHKFISEIQSISEIGAKTKLNPTYVKNFTEALQRKIASDAVNIYRVHIFNQADLLFYLHQKYKKKLTLFNYKKIVCDENLEKWGLTWKYKNKKKG